MKKVVLLVVSVIFLVSLIACGGDKEQATSSNSADKTDSKSIELRFSWWGGQERNEIYNNICDRFEEDYPNITIVREPISWNDYWTKIPTQIAGGGAPDIMQMHMRYVKLFSDRNALLQLDSYGNAGKIDFSHFSQAAIDTGVISGKNVMVSIGITSTGMVYNSVIKDTYNVDIPTEGWTWEDFLDLSKTYAPKLSQDGIYMCGDFSLVLVTDVTPFTMFMRSRGSDFYTVDGSIGFSKEDLQAWFLLWEEMRNIHAVPSAQISAEEATKTFEQQISVAGKQLFFSIPGNRVKIYQNLMPDYPLVMFRYPNTDGYSGEFLEGAHISINSATKHPEEAVLFLNYFVNNERSLELYLAENGFPASSKMNQFIYPLLDETNQKVSKFMDTVTADTSITPYVIPPQNNADIIRLLDQESQAVAFGQKSIDEAIESFFKAVENL